MSFGFGPHRSEPFGLGGRKPANVRAMIIVAAVVVGVAALFGLLRLGSTLLVDYWWFAALGFGSVYARILVAKVLLWWVGFGASFGAAAFGFVLAGRLAGPLRFMHMGQVSVPQASVRLAARAAFWAGAALVGLMGGQAAAELWEPALLWLNRVPFGVSDPIYANDVGFYMFSYPLAIRVRAMLLVLVWVSAVFAGIRYALAGALTPWGSQAARQSAVAHLSKALGVVFLLVAWGHYLDRYALLFSTKGQVFGPGYADIHGRLPACWIMFVASLGVAVVLFARHPLRRPRIVVGALAVWLVCALVFLGAWPPFLQRFRVAANELRLETPYIRHNIEQTLRAYGLDDVEVAEYPATGALTYDAVASDEGTIGNVRLWDWRPLRETYGQIQEIRTYYEFADVDVDRYEIDGRTTQVLLAVRELNSDKLAAEAQTWVNRHLQFTHGYGLAMSPVNEHTPEGLPSLLIRDIPPVTPEGLEVDRPQVYYGERTQDYVFVDTGTEEFDYPASDENKFTRHAGPGGVPVGGLLKRLLFALRFRDVMILLSGDLENSSRVMFRRTVAERVNRVAPYLLLDPDPYPVIHEGRIKWIQDAYTWTRWYPYSEPTGRTGLNYMRNAVKAVVDGYHGGITFYVADEDDPVIKAYARMFPGVYRPMSEMPEDLRRHVRYPVSYFNVQTAKYAAYHMQDPRVFYNREDMWAVPVEKYHGAERPLQSYYITMRLPGEDEPEFILMLPFTPVGKDNMIAWLAARCDGDAYGRLVAFTFPKQRMIYGPRQVEARIDQDPEISQQLTLWGQVGSSVIRGSLLVIPIAGDVLYVEPLYIRADEGSVPQLKRVITAYGERVSMAPTLEESLLALFGRTQVRVEPAPAAEPTAPMPGDGTARLVAGAVEDYRLAQAALAEGDWAAYGRHLDDMKAKLDELARLFPAEDLPTGP